MYRPRNDLVRVSAQGSELKFGPDASCHLDASTFEADPNNNPVVFALRLRRDVALETAEAKRLTVA